MNLLTATVGILASTTPLLAQIEFEGLGFLSIDFENHSPSSHAYDVNHDGTVIVGLSGFPGLKHPTNDCDDGQGCHEHSFNRPFMWTPDEGMTMLTGFSGFGDCCGFEPRSAAVHGVSPDGESGCGVVWDFVGGVATSNARWFLDTNTVQDLGSLAPGQSINARLLAINDGGSVAVGQDKLDGLLKPIVSVDGGTVENLLAPYGPDTTGGAVGVTTDGQKIAGTVWIAAGPARGVTWSLEGDEWVMSFLDDGDGIKTIVDAMTPDGSIIVGSRDINGDDTPFRWTEAGGFELLDMPDGAVWSNVTGVSDDGQVLVGSFSNFKAGLWDATNGWRHLEDVLIDADVLPSGWVLQGISDLSGDGSTMVGQAFDDQGYTQAFRAVVPRPTDTDGDGLLDSWETDGIPYEIEGGGQFLYVIDVDGDGISDADPMHKDLFVELDSMELLSFSNSVINDLVVAFDEAPVENPDGFDGIELHIVMDDDTIPFQEVTETPDNGWPASAPGLRENYFGTLTERLDFNADVILEAKAKAYRYCLLLNEASTNVGGIAEYGGDDFIIFAGSYPGVHKSAVFMHELGHTLGLHHGGGDAINGKPNYPSIMNYVIAYKSAWNQDFWRLDFSREQLPTLEENDLDETLGIGWGGSGTYDDFAMPFYTIVPHGAECFPEDDWGQPKVAYALLDTESLGQDFNADCDKEDTFVVADLNYLPDAGLPGSVTPSPGQSLVGHDDWANITLAISDGGGAFSGPIPSDEMTKDQLEYIEQNFPPPPRVCTADCNADGQLNILDFVCFQNLFSTGDAGADCNADGQLDILDFVCFQEQFEAGCD